MSAVPSRWLRARRKLALALHLLTGIAVCALGFPWLGERARAAYQRRWSAQLLRICGLALQVQVDGGDAGCGAAEAGVMLAANHISWLDIFAINAWQPVRFVAKADIRRWPVVGWLAANTGTLFIDRGQRSAVKHMLHAIAAALQAQHTVCVFPEGTTSDGLSLLPFHSNLLQAPIAVAAPVRPLTIRYLDVATGAPTTAAAYIGEMSLLASLEAILSAPPMMVRVQIGAPVPTASLDRQALAATLRSTIATTLAQPR